MINKKKILAIIPARLKSKRLKKKNLLKINNKSLIELAFLSAIKSKYIDKIILSIEGSIIKKLKKKIDSEFILKRPRHLTGSNVSSEEVVIDILKKLKEKYFYIILLQPTSPLRTTKDIDKAIRKVDKFNFDNLVSIFLSLEKKNYFLKIKNNFLVRKNEESKKNNKNYLLNGAIYITKVKNFFKTKSFFSEKKTGFIIMPKNRSIDIDYKSDYLKAKNIFKYDL